MPTCKRGEILRKGYKRRGYTRANGTKVKATTVKAGCIKDRGKKGKGPKLITDLKKGTLTQYGYSSKYRLVGERRPALKKAIKNLGALRVQRKLNAVATLNKNTNPTKSKRMKADANWVSREYLR